MSGAWSVAAVLYRDARIALSYRLNALLSVTSAFFSVALWYFLSLALTPRTSGWASGGYFAYIITGTALLGYVQVALHTFARRVREDQQSGTLEILLGAPVPLYVTLGATALWDMGTKTLEIVVFLAIAMAFGLRLHLGSPVALLLLVALTIVDFMAIGMVAASLLLVFQRGEPVTPFVGALFALLGGVFFPTKTLPPLLDMVSKLLPLPYALDGLRGVLLQSKGLMEVWPSIVALLIFAVLLLPLAVGVFALCLKVARRCGLLGKY